MKTSNQIRDFYGTGKLAVSIEIFPPKEESGDASLFKALARLAASEPAFVSCTYGAGGSTRGRTLDLCEHVQRELSIPATAHFTCIGSSRKELVDWLTEAHGRGIRNIMALRGDAPRGEAFQAHPDGLSYANELVTLIKTHFPDMGVGVAGYPEVHPEAKSAQSDMDYLKRKVDAGADAVYTQLFFSNGKFLDFFEKYQKAGIKVPLIPGIMPITDYDRIQRIVSMCGTEFPEDLRAKLEKAKEDKQAQLEIGVEHALNQCRELINSGVQGVHFYALNLSKATKMILDGLGYPLVEVRSATS